MNQNQERNWEQVQAAGDQGTRWEPQKKEPFNPQDPYNVIQGYFKDLLEKMGPEGPFQIVQIQTIEQNGALGEIYDCSGGKVLIEQMQKIKMGSYICIKYCGKQKSKMGGRSYNLWETFVDSNAIPLDQLIARMSPQAAAPAPQAAAPSFQSNAPTFNPPAAGAPTFTPPAPIGNSPGSIPEAAPINTGFPANKKLPF
jgi:hypothetical protein